MAVGSSYVVLYKPYFALDGMDLSKVVSQVGLSIEYATVDPRHVIGVEGPVAGFSPNYSWAMEVTFLTDEFGTDSLEAVLQAILPAPISTNKPVRFTDGDGVTNVALRPDRAVVGESNPQWSGAAVFPMWNPIGGGAISSFIENQVTLSGLNELTRYAPASTTKPPTPGEMTVDRSVAKRIKLTWPSNPNTTSLRVRSRITGTSGWSNTNISSGTATTVTISGLTTGRVYEFQIRATNSNGSSDWSRSVTALVT